MRKGYALYSKNVRARDKYKVSAPPLVQFTTRRAAMIYAKNNNIDAKVLVVYGLPALFM